MRFEWPWALAGLLVVPLVLLLALLARRRKRRFAIRYSSLTLVREALPHRSRARRLVPFVLFLSSLAALVVAGARPEITVGVPRGQTSVILAVDVSRSMCATDVDPNRLVVAQDAARRFVDDQPDGTRLGIVAFAGTAQVVVPPTTDHERLRAAIDGLTTSIGTAIGNAVLTSLDALSEVNPAIAPSTVLIDPGAGGRAPDDFEPDIIVLLTDGANTRGVEPEIAAQQAADRGVRVYTIGFGTTNPVELVCTREQLGGDAFLPDLGGFGVPGGPGFPGGPDVASNPFLLIDEPTLRAIADTTGGEYFRAENAEQLVDVFGSLPSRVVEQDEPREVSAVFVAVGAGAMLLALGLALRWNRIL